MRESLYQACPGEAAAVSVVHLRDQRASGAKCARPWDAKCARPWAAVGRPRLPSMLRPEMPFVVGFLISVTMVCIVQDPRLYGPNGAQRVALPWDQYIPSLCCRIVYAPHLDTTTLPLCTILTPPTAPSRTRLGLPSCLWDSLLPGFRTPRGRRWPAQCRRWTPRSYRCADTGWA